MVTNRAGRPAEIGARRPGPVQLEPAASDERYLAPHSFVTQEKTEAQFARLDKIAADAEKRGLRTLAVTYEGLQAPCRGCAEDKAAGLARVARFVLPKPGACAKNFTFAGREDDGDVKLHAATVAESITNWPEVVDKLRGTRFEKYLTMDGSVLP